MVVAEARRRARTAPRRRPRGPPSAISSSSVVTTTWSKSPARQARVDGPGHEGSAVEDPDVLARDALRAATGRDHGHACSGVDGHERYSRRRRALVRSPWMRESYGAGAGNRGGAAGVQPRARSTGSGATASSRASVLPLYWLAWLLLAARLAAGHPAAPAPSQAADAPGRVESGRIGWTQVFFEELIGSARGLRRGGPRGAAGHRPRPAVPAAVPREPAARRPDASRARRPHAGPAVAPVAGARPSRSRGTCCLSGRTPVVVLTDAFYRRQRWHAACLTAFSGVVLTFAPASVLRPIFPHRRDHRTAADADLRGSPRRGSRSRRPPRRPRGDVRAVHRERLLPAQRLPRRGGAQRLAPSRDHPARSTATSGAPPTRRTGARSSRRTSS